MASATQIADLANDTLELALERAEGLVGDVDVDVVVHQVKHHRLRTALIGLVVIALIALVVRKAMGGDDDLPS